jgi:hypothetical protein
MTGRDFRQHFGHGGAGILGALRIVANLDFRRVAEIARVRWRGWNESDLASLGRKLDDPLCYSGGIVKITAREYRAWAEFNRRVTASDARALQSPLLAWVEGRGLYPVIRVHHDPATYPAP